MRRAGSARRRFPGNYTGSENNANIIDESADDQVAITVSDPLQSPMTDRLTVTLNMALQGPGVASARGASVVTIPMPGKPMIGKSVTRIYRR